MRTDDETPLVAGGQGRSASEVELAAVIAVACMVGVVLIVLAIAIVT